MQISVSLQEPFSYSIFPMIVIFIILVVSLVYLFLKRKSNKPIPKIKKLEIKDLDEVKLKYINQLNMLEQKLDVISVREGYQELSSIIRFFVFEVTGIKVQNYALRDMAGLNMPVLYELIQEYYLPEFSEKSVGNIKLSLEKTREVIKKWN